MHTPARMFLFIVSICAVVGGVCGAVVAGGGGFIFGGFIGLTLGIIFAAAYSRRKYRANIPASKPASTTRRAAKSSTPPRIQIGGEAVAPRAVAPPLPRQKPTLRWIEPGESILHAGHQISSGMFFVCDGAPDVTEASAINRRLRVGIPARGPEAQLGYYSQYDFISPNQRAAYLEWLAADRRDEDPATRDLGYIFLFFYGLERRLLIDQGDGQEIVAEIV